MSVTLGLASVAVLLAILDVWLFRAAACLCRTLGKETWRQGRILARERDEGWAAIRPTFFANEAKLFRLRHVVRNGRWVERE